MMMMTEQELCVIASDVEYTRDHYCSGWLLRWFEIIKALIAEVRRLREAACDRCKEDHADTRCPLSEKP